MTAFETFLLSKGYKKYFLNKQNVFEETTKHQLSTMAVLVYYYFKGNNPNPITFGLNQRGCPPTLIHPRPEIRITNKTDNGWIMMPITDAIMTRILDSVPHQQIYNAMFDRTLVLTFSKP